VAKPGDEHYLLLPTYATNNGQTETTIPAGDYYLAVNFRRCGQRGSEHQPCRDGQRGLHAAEPRAGANRGVGQRGGGGADLVKAGETLGGGAVKFYTFTVPAGLASVQVSLEDRTGNPLLGLPAGPERLGRGYIRTTGPTSTGWTTGGGAAVQEGPSFVTLANPTAGTYAVSVRACVIPGDTYPDAGYRSGCRGWGRSNVSFDGGSASVTGQAAGAWRYYRIDVPAGVLGWDLRLVNVTSGSPWLVVRRDQLPADLNTTGTWTGYGNWGGRRPRPPGRAATSGRRATI